MGIFIFILTRLKGDGPYQAFFGAWDAGTYPTTRIQGDLSIADTSVCYFELACREAGMCMSRP